MFLGIIVHSNTSLAPRSPRGRECEVWVFLNTLRSRYENRIGHKFSYVTGYSTRYLEAQRESETLIIRRLLLLRHFSWKAEPLSIAVLYRYVFSFPSLNPKSPWSLVLMPSDARLHEAVGCTSAFLLQTEVRGMHEVTSALDSKWGAGQSSKNWTGMTAGERELDTTHCYLQY